MEIVAAIAVYLYAVLAVAKFCGFNQLGHDDDEGL